MRKSKRRKICKERRRRRRWLETPICVVGKGPGKIYPFPDWCRRLQFLGTKPLFINPGA